MSAIPQNQIGTCSGSRTHRGPGPTYHTGPHAQSADCKNWEPLPTVQKPPLTDELRKQIADLQSQLAEERAEVIRLKHAMAKTDAEICQTLAQAIGGYPWYRDDQANFPGTTEAEGVCVGDHVAASLASEAAICIREERAKRGELLKTVSHHAFDWSSCSCLCGKKFRTGDGVGTLKIRCI